MNKTELVAAMAGKAELSKKDAESALKAFVDVVTDELKKGEKVQLVGFGSFEVAERAAREGINPLTKQPMSIPASKAPKFKAGRGLKDAVNAYSCACYYGFLEHFAIAYSRVLFVMLCLMTDETV